MRLHFYTGMAMSVLAAELVNANLAESETALDTIYASEYWATPSELSQIDSELDLERPICGCKCPTRKK